MPRHGRPCTPVATPATSDNAYSSTQSPGVSGGPWPSGVRGPVLFVGPGAPLPVDRAGAGVVRSEQMPARDGVFGYNLSSPTSVHPRRAP
jgi:hypothetical protein